MDRQKALAVFEDYKIRRIYDETSETWYFSVVDIVAVLIRQRDYQAARNYWKVLKNRLRKEGSQTDMNRTRTTPMPTNPGHPAKGLFRQMESPMSLPVNVLHHVADTCRTPVSPTSSHSADTNRTWLTGAARVVDLCCGMGGLSVAARDLGMSPLSVKR